MRGDLTHFVLTTLIQLLTLVHKNMGSAVLAKGQHANLA